MLKMQCKKLRRGMCVDDKSPSIVPPSGQIKPLSPNANHGFMNPWHLGNYDPAMKIVKKSFEIPSLAKRRAVSFIANKLLQKYSVNRHADILQQKSFVPLKLPQVFKLNQLSVPISERNICCHVVPVDTESRHSRIPHRRVN